MNKLDWTHLHLALNHIPVVGILFIFGLLILGIWRGSEELKRLSLQLSIGLFFISMMVKITGEQSAAELFPKPSVEMKRWIDAHEESADQAMTCVFLLGVMAAAGLYLSKKRRILPAWAIIGSSLLCFITMLLLGRSANLGGQIAHPEIRVESNIKNDKNPISSQPDASPISQ